VKSVVNASRKPSRVAPLVHEPRHVVESEEGDQPRGVDVEMVATQRHGDLAQRTALAKARRRV